ncbi:hypothetical protein JXA85_06020 [Candidatus Woesearchaeota archaeon]|nr:hypothetical protein [Candidatus Woesearchaeota archaeon]
MKRFNKRLLGEEELEKAKKYLSSERQKSITWNETIKDFRNKYRMGISEGYARKLVNSQNL